MHEHNHGHQQRILMTGWYYRGSSLSHHIFGNDHIIGGMMADSEPHCHMNEAVRMEGPHKK